MRWRKSLRVSPRTKDLLWLTAVVALPRVLVFPFVDNWFGDAIIRAELGERWANGPHFIGSYAQRAFQFGPLHIFLVGLATWLWPVKVHAGRVVSLVAGIASAWPLHALTHRLFGASAARVAVLAFACWGMHVQFSTTAASEALGVLLVLATCAALARAFDTKEREALLGAGLLLTLACATRYDAWLWVPMLGLATWWRLGFRSGALLVAVASVFPLAWTVGNWVDVGAPFKPLEVIEAYHHDWFPKEAANWGARDYRVINAVFWPLVALFTLSPLVAVAGIVGVWKGAREKPELRWLAVLVVVPTLYFTVRSSVLGTFAPMARFASKEVVLLLPFVGFGLAALWAPLRKPVTVLALAIAVALPVWVGAVTYQQEGLWEDTMRPVSPMSNQPRAMKVATAAVRREVTDRGDALILDRDDVLYRDLSVAFFSMLPEPRLARLRWEDFESKRSIAQPHSLLRIEGGLLDSKVGEGGVLDFDGTVFDELPGLEPPFHLYRARPPAGR